MRTPPSILIVAVRHHMKDQGSPIMWEGRAGTSPDQRVSNVTNCAATQASAGPQTMRRHPFGGRPRRDPAGRDALAGNRQTFGGLQWWISCPAAAGP